MDFWVELNLIILREGFCTETLTFTVEGGIVKYIFQTITWAYKYEIIMDFPSVVSKFGQAVCCLKMFNTRTAALIFPIFFSINNSSHKGIFTT